MVFSWLVVKHWNTERKRLGCISLYRLYSAGLSWLTGSLTRWLAHLLTSWLVLLLIGSQACLAACSDFALFFSIRMWPSTSGAQGLRWKTN